MADSAEANLMPPPPPQPEHGAGLEGQPDHGPQSQPGPNKQDLARQIQVGGVLIARSSRAGRARHRKNLLTPARALAVLS